MVEGVSKIKKKCRRLLWTVPKSSMESLVTYFVRKYLIGNQMQLYKLSGHIVDRPAPAHTCFDNPSHDIGQT